MWRSCVAFLMAVLLTLAPAVAHAEAQSLESTEPFEMNAVSVLLLDAGTGTVILEKNADEKRPVASITKMMTILLVLEALESGKISLEDEVTVSQAAAGMGGSQALLDAGGVYSVEDLLKSLIVASANDSAVALAELLMGSEQNFAEEMNRRAAKLGLQATHYVNASGLPAEGQYTTARDVALLSLQVLQHPQYFEYSTIWMDEIRHKNDRVTDLVNTNRLIRFYEGADGVKTGSTNEAGYCVCATAQRGQERFIAVVLGAPTSSERFDLAGKLLTHAFDHYSTETLLSAGETVLDGILVKGGQVRQATLVAQDDLKALVRRGEEEDLEVEFSAPSVLQAPLSAGEAVGEAVAMRSGEVVARVPLVLEEDLDKRGYWNSVAAVLVAWMKTGQA